MQRDEIVCADLCAELQSSMGSRVAEGVTFLCEADAGLLLIGDRIRWMQVLMNLSSNALKFTTKTGGFVKVRITKTAHKILCEVTDTGAIIPLHTQRRLFDKYEQVKNLQVGTGLGLVIAQNIVKIMGSQVMSNLALTPPPGPPFSLNPPTPHP
jgi:signal transduction histidine kinase